MEESSPYQKFTGGGGKVLTLCIIPVLARASLKHFPCQHCWTNNFLCWKNYNRLRLSLLKSFHAWLWLQLLHNFLAWLSEKQVPPIWITFKFKQFTSLKHLIPIVYPIPSHIFLAQLSEQEVPHVWTTLQFNKQHSSLNTLVLILFMPPFREANCATQSSPSSSVPAVNSSGSYFAPPYQCYNATVLLGDSPISLPASAKLFSSPHHHLQLR